MSIDQKLDKMKRGCSEEELDQVTGGWEGARTEVRLCKNCGVYRVVYPAGNGYVCKTCQTLNKY